MKNEKKDKSDKYEQLKELMERITEDNQHEEIFSDVQGEEKI
ncbi:hypothetical protein [Salipaludibacillus neizhouensis]|nr:hypothetical protein [Salipaludibacillus neizhouensis]